MLQIGQARCYCQRGAAVATSWKDGNVGRRFFECEKYPNDGYCNFFHWIDPPLCDRAKQIVAGLLKRVNEQREETRNMEMIAEKLNEMTRVLESEIDKLMQEIRGLKEEDKILICQIMKMKEENRKYCINFSCNLKLVMKVSIMFAVFFGFMNMVYQLLGLDEGKQMKMIG